MVTEITGPGPFVVWDKGTFAFYLCAAPMYPQTGLPFAGSGSYDTGGRVVDAAVARRSSTDVTVSVSVVWYLRGNRLLKSYSYTSIDGAAPSTWTYASDNTFAPTGTQTGFRGHCGPAGWVPRRPGARSEHSVLRSEQTFASPPYRLAG